MAPFSGKRRVYIQTAPLTIETMPAHVDIQARFLACYEDPRDDVGFEGEWYPAEPVAARLAPEGVDEAKARFKAVYARRNACVVALANLPPGDPGRRQLVDQILQLTEAIDHLEDVYAPTGIVAEPAMGDDMFARELRFTHAPIPTPGEPEGVSSFSLYIPIPLDDELEPEDQHAS
jgi:hypothetical protein